jgi:hypothetical protein
MINLSIWESFIIQAAVSLLTYLDSTITNATEKAAIEAAISFLSRLLGNGVKLD